MSILTVTAKGQVTLKRDVLRHLGVNPGDRIMVEKIADGRIEAKALPPAGKISDIFNLLRRSDDAPALSIEEMGKIAAEGWAGRR